MLWIWQTKLLRYIANTYCDILRLISTRQLCKRCNPRNANALIEEDEFLLLRVRINERLLDTVHRYAWESYVLIMHISRKCSNRDRTLTELLYFFLSINIKRKPMRGLQFIECEISRSYGNLWRFDL